MTKKELENLCSEGQCFKSEQNDATYYAFSFSKYEHIFAVLKEEADIEWYKTDVLELTITNTIIRGADEKYFDEEMAKNEAERFKERRPEEFNKMCYFKTSCDEYIVFMNIINLS